MKPEGFFRFLVKVYAMLLFQARRLPLKHEIVITYLLVIPPIILAVGATFACIRASIQDPVIVLVEGVILLTFVFLRKISR